MRRCIWNLLAFMIGAAVWAPMPGYAADAVPLEAVDMAGGYGAQVLEKLVPFWQPPAGISGVATVSLRIGNDGRPLFCEAVKHSGNAAFDESPCQAAIKAGSFGAPPYGAVTQVFVTLATDRSAYGAAPAAQNAQGKTRSYAEEIMYRAKPFIQVPPGLKGSFQVELTLRVNPSGTLESFTVSKSSGRADVDNAVIGGVTRDGAIPVPPAGSPTQNIILLFTVQGN